jgi:geranylgeranyl transferase type-2 subunit beta
MSYLENLTLRLMMGAARLPDETRRRNRAFLAAAQADDGGFAGRQGPSDLYYTGFALRGLVLLDGLSGSVAERAGRFLRRRLAGEMPSIDFFSLIQSALVLETTSAVNVFAQAGCDRREIVTRTLERFRRGDGGYAKTARSPHSSTYHTFLAASCRQLVGLPLDDGPKLVELIRSRRREDGGFVELAPLKRGATNPTAAAIGLLRLARALDEPIRQAAAAFLAGMQNAEGGFRANRRVPVADLLSTFTALATLADLDALSAVDPALARRYGQSLELAEGGFRGGAWDDTADVEYTFYGVGTLALVAGFDSHSGVV